MKTTSPIATILISTIAGAQPVLTQALNEPQPGESYALYHYDSTTTLPRATGTGQFWDFSTTNPFILQSNNHLSFPFSYSAASAVPESSLFPGATMAMGLNSYHEFYKSISGSNAQLEYLGNIYTNQRIILSDSKIISKWPFSLGNSYIDTYSGVQSWSSQNYNLTGTIQVQASGHGTLVLPNGSTFSDVLQVTSIDFMVRQGAFIDTIRPVEQAYYISGVKEPVLILKDENSLSNHDSVWIMVNKFVVAGFAEHQGPTELYVFPNPASEVLNISFGSSAANEYQIDIFNVIGQKVRPLRRTDSGNNSLIDLAGLPTGIYTLQVRSDKTIVSRKFLLN